MLQTTGTSKLGTGSGVSTLEQITALDKISALDSLTGRELEVLGLIANGDSNQSIADKLVIEPKTVGYYITTIYSKLQFDEDVDKSVDKRVMAALAYYRTPNFLSSQPTP